jgi:glycosyltransferase involved in cell wall biosynthesis
MKIAFIESFLNKEWNGYTARYVEGVSGTHSAIFYLAEAIAKQNHDVTVIQQYANFEPKWVNGVFYQCMKKMPEDDTTLYDVLVFTFKLEDTNIFNKIKNYKKIAFIMNCIELTKFCFSPHEKSWFYDSPKFFTSSIRQGDYVTHRDFLNILDRDKVNILYVSENSKINTFFINRQIESIRHHLLYNSIDIQDFINKDGELYTLPQNEKENNFIFFACIERGYNIVMEVAKRFQGKFNIVASNYDNKKYISDSPSHVTENSEKNISNEKFSIVSYNEGEAESKNEFFETKYGEIKILHPKNTSKQELFSWNRRSKYFIYPCFNSENRYIHYDTFAYVVLEALLCGTIVIAPRMRVFEELYGDAIYYINTTGILDQTDLIYSHWWDPKNNMIWDKKFPNITNSFINRYEEAIKHLESDIELRNTYIQRGFSLKNKFSNHLMANSFLNFFSR